MLPYKRAYTDDPAHQRRRCFEQVVYLDTKEVGALLSTTILLLRKRPRYCINEKT